MKNKITKLFTLLTMAAMSMGVWATTVSIPQALDSYINWGDAVTMNNCTVENEGANVGSTKQDANKKTYIKFALSNAVEQAYYFTMKSATQNAAILRMTVKNNASTLYTKDLEIANTGGYSAYNNLHQCSLGVLPVSDDLTLELEVISANGGYAGNWKDLAIRGASQWATDRIPGSTAIVLTNGDYHDCKTDPNNPEIAGWIRNGSYVTYTVYNEENANLNMEMGMDRNNEGSVRVRVYDIDDTTTPEVDQTFDLPASSAYANQVFPITNGGVSHGFKQIRLDFIRSGDGYILNYTNLCFTKSSNYDPVKSLTIDGDVLNRSTLLHLNKSGESYTFTDHIYTNLPSVVGSLESGADLAVSSRVEGTNVIYTLSDNSEFSVTLTIEGVHVYTKTSDDEVVQLKYTSAGKTDNTWTNGTYTIAGSGLDGSNNSVFKFSHQGDGVHTLSVPSNVVVKQVIIKDWGMNYNDPPYSTITSVTSTSASGIYVPTHSEAYYNAPRDLIINIDGHKMGEDIVISMYLHTQTIGWFELLVSDHYTRTHPHMNLNTLCYPYRIDSYTGATFYNILSTTVEGGNLTELVLEEHVGALEAGLPYFYDPTPGAAELVCYYSGAEVSTPGTAAGGAFVGTYVDDAPVPSGSYVTVNNQLYKTGDGATMGEYRAYVRPQAYTRAALSGRKILRIGDKGTTTAVETLLPDASCSQKILRNGQVIIIRGDKKYNMLGQEL